MILVQKWGVMGRGQKIGVFRLSRDWPTMRQIGHSALDTQAQVDSAKTQHTQALVLTGRHVYYTLVRKTGPWVSEKRGRGCLRNARLGGETAG